eukprot:3884839-Pleurochrysis_carterae.AAC.1
MALVKLPFPDDKQYSKDELGGGATTSLSGTNGLLPVDAPSCDAGLLFDTFPPEARFVGAVLASPTVAALTCDALATAMKPRIVPACFGPGRRRQRSPRRFRLWNFRRRRGSFKREQQLKVTLPARCDEQR